MHQKRHHYTSEFDFLFFFFLFLKKFLANVMEGSLRVRFTFVMGLRSGNPGPPPPPDLLHPHWSLRTTGLIWFQTCGRSNRFPSVLAGGRKSFSSSWRSTEMFGMINHWTAAPLEPSRKNKDQKLLEHETIQNGRLNSAACFVIPSFFFHTDSTKNPSKKINLISYFET